MGNLCKIVNVDTVVGRIEKQVALLWKTFMIVEATEVQIWSKLWSHCHDHGAVTIVEAPDAIGQEVDCQGVF